MGKVAILLYGVVCYLAFLVTILYAIGFSENLVVPKGIEIENDEALRRFFDDIHACGKQRYDAHKAAQ